MTEAQKQKLEQQLWNIANELRGKMGADEFRDYILGFIFYKYLSEKQYIYANKLLETEDIKDYALVTDKEDLKAIKEESLLKLGYFLRPDELFTELSRKGNADTEEESNFILEDLQSILNSIEQSTMGTESEDDFNQLFEDLDLNSTKLGRSVEARNSLIAKVLSHLDKIDFALEDTNADVLGDAYEYLIAQFASGAGKKAGEFYTPQQVSKILAKVVTLDKKRVKSAYDPACGSGSLLLRIAKEAEVSKFYGQELNRTTYNLARMNMILHDVHFSKFNIKQEDTLEFPQHLAERFDVVVANPPFSAKWKGKNNPLNETDDRFSQYGALAPATKADFAFILHMVYQLNDSGTMAVVLPHGVLFRGAAEGKIRQYIIQEQNYLDTVIGLPANLFYGTSIPACILVFKRCRVHDENILFIDASQEFEKVGNQNALADEHVDKILNAVQRRENIDKYAYVASLAEIEENDYNLNIPRYVDTFEEEEPVDLEAVVGELRALETDMEETDKTIAGFCQELGISIPVGFNLPLLKQYKKGMMQKLFPAKDETVPELRFPGFEREWKQYVLGDLLDITSASRVHKDEWTTSGVPFFRSSDVVAAYKGLKNSKAFISFDLYEQLSNKSGCVRKNDLLVTGGGSIGIPYLVMSDDPLYFKDADLLWLKNTDRVTGYFLYIFFITPIFRRYLARITHIGTIAHYTVEQAKSTPIKVPSKKEQEKIADFLSSIDKKINLISTQLTQAKTFKKGLLQQMFI